MPKRLRLHLLLCILTLVTLVASPLRAQNYDSLMRAHGLVDVQVAAPRIQVQLKYATKDNFTGANMYGSLRKAYLPRSYWRRSTPAIVSSSTMQHVP